MIYNNLKRQWIDIILLIEAKLLRRQWIIVISIMETNEIKETMVLFAINLNRDYGFWARRWNFFELINNRGDTIIRSHRVLF